jgi:hypothetical protein
MVGFIFPFFSLGITKHSHTFPHHITKHGEFRACSNHQELQKRLIEPEDDEEAARRATLAKQRLGDGSAVVWM